MDIQLSYSLLLLTCTGPPNWTTHKLLLTRVQSNSGSFPRTDRVIPKRACPRALKAGSPKTRGVKRQNRTAFGIWGVIAEVVSWVPVLETEYSYLKSFKSSIYGNLLTYLDEYADIEDRLVKRKRRFVPLSLMLPSDKSMEPGFFLITFVVPVSRERKLVGSAVLGVLDVFRLSFHCSWLRYRRGFLWDP